MSKHTKKSPGEKATWAGLVGHLIEGFHSSRNTTLYCMAIFFAVICLDNYFGRLQNIEGFFWMIIKAIISIGIYLLIVKIGHD
jgi:hypothetical protein